MHAKGKLRVEQVNDRKKNQLKHQFDRGSVQKILLNWNAVRASQHEYHSATLWLQKQHRYDLRMKIYLFILQMLLWCFELAVSNLNTYEERLKKTSNNVQMHFVIKNIRVNIWIYLL